ncbi:MAG: LON peptidase substrate-binding domain-containing protein [Anaerolineales bacterium]
MRSISLILIKAYLRQNLGCIINTTMFELPLFPLNTVLFPGMPLPLHIFEARYKQMIGECLEADRLFGVVLIRHGSEALGPLAEPHTIGCTARIMEVQPLEEGRMHITIIGERRFRILSLKYELPYLVGEVELHPLPVDDSDKLLPVAEQLTPKVRQYIKLLNQIEAVDLDPDNLPQDPLMLGHLAPVLLQMPPGEKQNLLKSESAFELLDSTNQVYTREIAFLRAIIERDQDQSQNSVLQN